MNEGDLRCSLLRKERKREMEGERKKERACTSTCGLMLSRGQTGKRSRHKVLKSLTIFMFYISLGPGFQPDQLTMTAGSILPDILVPVSRYVTNIHIHVSKRGKRGPYNEGLWSLVNITQRGVNFEFVTVVTVYYSIYLQYSSRVFCQALTNNNPCSVWFTVIRKYVT